MIGQTVPHYRIIEKLGQGGMGVVYKALDTRLDRCVAVKILPSESVPDTERRRRFVQEAKAASALNHPGIATVHDLDSSGDLSFIVRVDGGDPAFAVSRITADPGLTFSPLVSPDGKHLPMHPTAAARGTSTSGCSNRRDASQLSGPVIKRMTGNPAFRQTARASSFVPRFTAVRPFSWTPCEARSARSPIGA